VLVMMYVDRFDKVMLMKVKQEVERDDDAKINRDEL
jgi:hypothetical protein